MPRKVILDTSAIYALISASDQFHLRANEVYSDLVDGGDELRTTSYIMVETAALVHRRLGFQLLKAFVDSMAGVVDILWIDRITHEESWRRMVGRDGAQLSFVDWSTIVTAENTRSVIFAFDQDFSAQGLQVLS
jgi:predicted nucleic acid-binding protein